LVSGASVLHNCVKVTMFLFCPLQAEVPTQPMEKARESLVGENLGVELVQDCAECMERLNFLYSVFTV